MNLKDQIKQKLDEIEDESALKEILNFINDRDKLWTNKFGRYFFPTSVIFAVITICYLTCHFQAHVGLEKEKIDSLDFVLYGIWALLTPLWFLYEYNFLFPDHLKFNNAANSDFKYTQELSNKFWIALLVIFSSILLAKYSGK